MNRADTFNRADGGNVGTPSDGGSAWVHAVNPAFGWGISSNAAYNVYDAGINHYWSTLECSAADGDVQVTLSTTAGSGFVGLAARVSGDDDGLLIRASSGGGYELYKFVSGSATLLGSWGTAPADGDVLKWTMSGSGHTVYVNGVSRITATDGFNSTATKHGLHANAAWPTSARWDDFSFTDAGGGATDGTAAAGPLGGVGLFAASAGSGGASTAAGPLSGQGLFAACAGSGGGTATASPLSGTGLFAGASASGGATASAAPLGGLGSFAACAGTGTATVAAGTLDGYGFLSSCVAFSGTSAEAVCGPLGGGGYLAECVASGGASVSLAPLSGGGMFSPVAVTAGASVTLGTLGGYGFLAAATAQETAAAAGGTGIFHSLIISAGRDRSRIISGG